MLFKKVLARSISFTVPNSFIYYLFGDRIYFIRPLRETYIIDQKWLLIRKWLKRKKCGTTCLQSCKSLAPCSRAVCIVKNLKSYKPEKPMYMMHYNVFNCHNILLKASLQLKKTTTKNPLEIKYANSFVNFLYIPFFLPFFFESSAIINVTFPMKS